MSKRKMRKKEKKENFGKNKKNLLLRITMYTFIVTILLSLSLFISLFIYSKNLNFQMPEVVKIEVYDNDNNLIETINNTSNRSYVILEDVSPNIIKAFLSIEDKEYYNHQGVNFKRIIGALIADIKNKDMRQGGSTITQQYVKNTFLTSEKTLKRKIDEALIAINLENNYTKDEILEGYLNTIYFDHGLNGINDACLYYFNKHPKDITLNEACVLAAIPKSPINYSPIKNYDNNNSRRKLILTELLKDNSITIDEYNENIDQEVELYGKLDSSEIKNSPYYLDYVMKLLNEMKISSSKGIKVYTSIDNNLNRIIQESINKYLPKNSNLELAIVAMDTKGNVLASIGGKDYLTSTYNRTMTLRQPGSTIKTFLYYAALENGFNISHTFYSAPTDFYTKNGKYSPHNYGEVYPYQDVSMAYAIATSDNIYAMKTHLYLGTHTLYNTLLDFGFNKKIKNNESLALGTSEVSLTELTLGYAKIASMGKDLESTYIKKITTMDGEILYKRKYEYEERFNPKTCYLLSEALTNVFDNRVRVNITPTCASISSMLKGTYAAKSGSTDYDGWIVGYNNNIILGIWTGYDDNTIVNNKDTKYIKYIWANIMKEYNKRNYWFKTPSNIIGIKMNPVTGKITTDNEYQKYLYFDINNLPDFLN